MRVFAGTTWGFMLVVTIGLGCVHESGNPMVRKWDEGKDQKPFRKTTALPEKPATLEMPVPPPAMDLVPLIAKPKTQPGAKRMLDRGFSDLKRENYPDAVAAFRAVLATDYLTEHGRMNLYWMTAKSHDGMNDRQGEWDALGDFLLAALVLPSNGVTNHRILWARSRLTALRVQEDHEYGRSPQKAIQVEDVREPAKIMAAMDCGPDGRGEYRSVSIRSFRSGPEQLIHRKMACEREELELWFDISYARSPDPANLIRE